MSGHKWGPSDKCELCGDKDWYADKYCAGNPEVKEKRDSWLKQLRDAPAPVAAQHNGDNGEDG